MLIRLRNALPILGLGLSVLLFKYGNYWSWHWFTKWTVLLAGVSLYLAYAASSKSSYWLFPILSYSLLSGVWYGASSFNRWGLLKDAIVRESIRTDALYGWISVASFCLLLAHFRRRHYSSTVLLLGVVNILSAAMTIWQWHTGSIAYNRGAFSGNASMNGVLIAATLPFALKIVPTIWLKVIIASETLLAVFLTGASQPVGVLLVVILAYCFHPESKEFRNSKYFAVFPVGAALILITSFLIIPDFLGSNGRFDIWRSVFSWVRHNGDIIFGQGLGTTMRLVTTLQLEWARASNRTGGIELFMWLHSEPLQIVFELGLVGGVCAFLGVLAITRLAWKSSGYLWCGWIGFMSMSVFNYPFRLALHAICFSFVAVLIFKNNRLRVKNDHY